MGPGEINSILMFGTHGWVTAIVTSVTGHMAPLGIIAAALRFP
jgi:hypothetical protein